MDQSDHEYHRLRKSLGVFDLTALGIGAIVGTGIFVLTGIGAAKYAGPALALSFVISGIAAVLAALVYSEMASAVPIAGSAYTYTYVTLGEFVAWLVGWNIILEYAVASGAVAAGWSGYLVTMLKAANFNIPAALTSSPFQGGIINLPAIGITITMTALLIIGAKQGSVINSIIVTIKLAVIVAFLVIGSTRINPANWHPFFPFGIMGAVKGAAIIFFAYIGFDAVSTAAEEVRDPQRNLPRGILASLGISTVLYVLVALVLTGLVTYKALNTAAPVAAALLAVGIRWGSLLVSVGAIAGLSSVLYATIFAQSRIFFAMGRDGLIPSWLSKVHPHLGTPYRITIIVGIVISLVGGFLPISTIAEMANIGTLFAFFTTSIGVIYLERIVPAEKLNFRVPFTPYLPIASALFSLYLAINLPAATWIRFIVWIAVGCLVYYFYGFSHSKANDGLPSASRLISQPAFKKLQNKQEE